MKKRIYVFSDTVVKRKMNTLCIKRVLAEPEEEQTPDEILEDEFLTGKDVIIPDGTDKIIPIEEVDSLMLFGTITFNTKLLNLLNQNGITLHTFSFNGSYSGSYIPSSGLVSAPTLINQAAHYTNEKKRLYIAKEVVKGAASNSLMNLNYYDKRGKNLGEFITEMNEFAEMIDECDSVEELMGLEGAIKKLYYAAWQYIFIYPTDFTRRVKRPPNNLINALISYGNMIVYSVCLNEIYHTRLYPEISFLHSSTEGRLNLSLDIAEIFKPLITDRVIFKAINKNIISTDECSVKNGRCFLYKKAKQSYASLIEDKFVTKIETDYSSNRLSYKRIIKEECYKLIKHLNGEELYQSYKSKW